MINLIKVAKKKKKKKKITSFDLYTFTAASSEELLNLAKSHSWSLLLTMK